MRSGRRLSIDNHQPPTTDTGYQLTATTYELICARMRLFVDLNQLRSIDMRISLGRAETGMTQQFLNRAQVGAIREQVRRE